jgi:hypothetical protein
MREIAVGSIGSSESRSLVNPFIVAVLELFFLYGCGHSTATTSRNEGDGRSATTISSPVIPDLL